MVQEKPLLIAQKDLGSLISLQSVLGKKVYSKSGEYVGKIIDVLAHKRTISAVHVKKPRTECMLDVNFIQSESQKTIMLSIDPVVLLLRKTVYDKAGKKLGKVIDIVKKGENDPKELIVKKSIFSRPITVSGSDIDVAKANILLKKTYE